jgi:hypothetical protein
MTFALGNGRAAGTSSDFKLSKSRSGLSAFTSVEVSSDVSSEVECGKSYVMSRVSAWEKTSSRTDGSQIERFFQL